MKNLLLVSICTFCISSCFNDKSSEKPSTGDTIPQKDTVIQQDTVKQEKFKEESTIEKGYYMLDKNQCLHTKICPILDSLYQVRYIDTCDVCKLTDVFYCHHCFNKEEVDKIEKKIKDYNKANEKKATKTEPDSTNTPLNMNDPTVREKARRMDSIIQAKRDSIIQARRNMW